MSKHESGNSEFQPDTRGQEFAARRRIVKGLASSVPVVMTIGCGQALAQASSLQCIARPTGLPDPEECTTAQDEWARRGDDCAVVDGANSVDSSSLFQKGSPYSSPFETQLDGISSTGGGVAGKGSPTLSRFDLQLDSVSQEGNCCLIYVDESGNEVTSPAGSPVTLSCYASFLSQPTRLG